MRQAVARRMFRYCLFLNPICNAILLGMMYSDKSSHEFTIYAILGTSLSSFWTIICFSSASDISREKYLGTLPETTKKEISRNKGLGEMDPEELCETTMKAEYRSLLRVNIDDMISADETFQTLMGEEVEPRKRFIEENAIYVENLDI